MASSISGRKVALVPLALAGAVVMAGCAQGSATSGDGGEDGGTLSRRVIRVLTARGAVKKRGPSATSAPSRSCPRCTE